MTGNPTADAILGIIAALGLRELLPRIVAALAARRGSIHPPPATTVNVQQAPLPSRSEQLGMMTGEATATTWTVERARAAADAAAALQQREREDERDLRIRVTALENVSHEHSTAIALINHETGELRRTIANTNLVLSEVRDIGIATATQVGVDTARFTKHVEVGAVRGGAAAPR